MFKEPTKYIIVGLTQRRWQNQYNTNIRLLERARNTENNVNFAEYSVEIAEADRPNMLSQTLLKARE